MAKIVMYGTPTCGDCILAKQVFAENNIQYKNIDITKSKKDTEKAIELNNGVRRIPVIVFEDQTILVEPNREQLLAKIN